MQKVTVRHAAGSDVGKTRSHNEDSFLVSEEDGLYLVADGMGGHAAGEVASRMAIETVSRFFQRSREGEVTWPFKLDPELPLVENRLVAGVKLASFLIHHEAKGDLARKGMGTTIVSAAIEGGRIHIAHVGDSRAYRIRDDEIEKLTRDHTLIEEFKRFNPDMTPEEEKSFGHTNVLNRALGVRDSVEVEVQRHELRPGDRFLLCSDGLYGMVEDVQMLATIVNADRDLDAAVRDLIEHANRNGGVDNVTAILIAV